MSIAITDEHLALRSSVSSFLDKRQARGIARELLVSPEEPLPPYWQDLADLGWLGLHVPAEYGGSGFGLPELVVVVEEMGRAIAPGPFVPTVIASALLSVAAGPDLEQRLLPLLSDGSLTGAVALDGQVEVKGGRVSGSAGVVLQGASAGVLLVASGNDVAVVEVAAGGVVAEVPANLDLSRRSARVTFDGAPAIVLPGARQPLVDMARLILASEATGVARQCTEAAAEYARVRLQFGRPIGTYQAVKHHCANMLVATELATAAVWDGARAASAGRDEFSYACAVAGSLAIAAGDLASNLNVQVHGGIGFTWEHDAHLYVRRAAAIKALLDANAAARDIVDLARKGVRRERSVDLPPEAETIRSEVRRLVESVRNLDADEQKEALLEGGYLMPHWPKPWGRDASAVEQLVIAEEMSAAGIARPGYGITGWVILTLIQHSAADQIARWVGPALRHEVIWCQLFSEPDAGSDAAGIKTRGTRVEGGWLVNGQKVWTSGAHVAAFGLATVRTNPNAPKHQGITTMVIDMHASGVEVRPLKMPTGASEFNEVYFDDVFVPDDDVVGPVDGGWTVARATLGNESVSIGSGGGGGPEIPLELFLSGFDAHPQRLAGGACQLGRYIASRHAADVMNLRTAIRAVLGGGPGPEGAVAKLVISENLHEAAAILSSLAGPDGAFLEGPGATGAGLVLMHRAMSIAGGTSEIKRSQIGERILGLPRDPLIS